MIEKESLHCWIYRSARKAEMYLYLPEQDGFKNLPPALLDGFGTPTLVMELDLHPDRSLAREDVNQVIANLRSKGYYLQLPPQFEVDLYRGD